MSAMLLSPAQVAQRLQVKERTVSDWLKSGKLRGTKVGRLWRVPPENLDEFLGNKTSAWTPPIREYTDEEIAQFLADDELDEETARFVDRLLAQ